MSEQMSKDRLREQLERPPILHSSGPYRGFGSKDWIARGAVQKVGTTIFGVVFLLGSVGLFFAALLVRDDTSGKMGDVMGPIARTLLALLGFSLGCSAMFFAIRLLRGVIRSFYK
jgi:hypothetical protein